MDQFGYDIENTRQDYIDMVQVHQQYDNTVPMLPLAVAYVRPQEWRKTYDEATALQRGTLFPELDLPWKEGGYR